MAGNNLKTIVTADTSQFKKEMKGAKDALKDFSKEGNGALSEISSMFGVNSSAIEGVVKNLGQANNAFKLLGTTGESSTTAMTAGMKALAGSIAGLGIMAAVAAFRELNEQAANFEQRLQGVNLAASARAYRDTYRQSLYDASGAGEYWANFWERSKTYFATNFAQIATLSFGNERTSKAASDAEAAARLASQMVDYRREERDLSIEIQRINNQIAAAQNTFRDAQASVTERKQAEATITDLINEKYGRQADLQQRMLTNIRERNLITGSTEAELDEQANLEKGLLALEGQRQQELNALLRTHNSIANAGSKQASAAKETQEATVLTLEAATALVQRQRELAQIAQQNNAMMSVARFNLDGALPRGEGIEGQANTMVIPGIIKPTFDTQEWTDISYEVAAIIEDALTSVGDSVGQLIGDLVTGGDAWGNFTNNAIQAFGDMATTVGKIAVSTGLAALGIKASLETLNPYVAIAAGTALIALGAAVRAGLSNVASGNYSTSVASSSYSSTGTYGQTSFGREMEVKVSGTLTANGSQLVAVLNNENDRKNYTT